MTLNAAVTYEDGPTSNVMRGPIEVADFVSVSSSSSEDDSFEKVPYFDDRGIYGMIRPTRPPTDREPDTMAQHRVVTTTFSTP